MSIPNTSNPEGGVKQPEAAGTRTTRRTWLKGLTIGSIIAAVGITADVLSHTVDIVDTGERAYRAINPLPTPTPTPRPLRQAVLHFARVGARSVTPAQVSTLSGRPLENFPPERLIWEGLIIDYRIEFQGLDNEVCTVHWTLFDDGNVPVEDDFWTTMNAAAWPNEAWDPETTDTDVQEGDAWIPYIAPGTFHIVLTVKDQRKQQLAELSTDPFDVPARGG